MVKQREEATLRQIRAAQEQPALEEIRLKKVPTFIQGLDEITAGGLPAERTSLIVGGPGSGKTLMAMEFIVRGAIEAHEPGVYLAFEENAQELEQNFASLGIDLNDLIRRKLLVIEYVKLERSEIEETGEYDLEGLFIRLGYAIDAIKAKRVVLDTIEALFASFQNEAVLRAELRRLFRWMKSREVTAIVTAERGDASLTKFGLEEYVADCVIFLDNRIINQIATRRLRIIKYRGSSHGMNEYPFLISNEGMTVLPITSNKLDQKASSDRISSGIPGLDAMLEGQGFFRGSTVLISGTAGTGKTSFAAQFAKAACERKEQVLYFAFEESQDAIVRNMRSIGVDLYPCIGQELVRFVATRPTFFGLEMHLVEMHRLVNKYDPQVVIIDPISNLARSGTVIDVNAMLARLIDFFKNRQITALMTSLTGNTERIDETEVGVSSLVDTWILLACEKVGPEQLRSLRILKSRGMAHSNKVMRLDFSREGVCLREIGKT